jgi:signal transduction histidine kinase
LFENSLEAMSLTQGGKIIDEYLKSAEYIKLISFHKKIELVTSLENDLLNFEGSPVHIFKTIMNLVSNSAEAAPVWVWLWSGERFRTMKDLSMWKARRVKAPSLPSTSLPAERNLPIKNRMIQ